MAKPVAVGAATVRAFYGYNTLTDTSTWDAVLRSTAYYTPVYAVLTRSVHPEQANDPQWGGSWPAWRRSETNVCPCTARKHEGFGSVPIRRETSKSKKRLGNPLDARLRVADYTHVIQRGPADNDGSRQAHWAQRYSRARSVRTWRSPRS